MAIQDFVGGSFRGKLGALVGMPWKDKNCIRTWAKPRNPRTERQQANRKRFSACVLASQIANQMDFRAIPFQSEENTVWGLRMKTALENWKADKPPIMYVPLLQSGQTAGIVINPSITTAGKKVTVDFLSDIDVSGKTLSVMVFEPFGKPFGGEYYLYQTTIQKTAAGYSFVIMLSDDIVNFYQCIMCATSFNEMSIAEKIIMNAVNIVAQ